jgi:hypothetical protein
MISEELETQTSGNLSVSPEFSSATDQDIFHSDEEDVSSEDDTRSQEDTEDKELNQINDLR